MKQRVHVVFSGRVQGVGFRYTALDIAREAGVTGWVKNTADGKVELVAEGEEEALKNFLARLQDRFSRYIRDTDLQWQHATKEFADFTITL